MKVLIVLDIICSASYVGYTRLTWAAEAWRAGGGHLKVTFLPLQLDPHASAAGEPLLAAQGLGEAMVARLFRAYFTDGLTSPTRRR